MIYNTPMVGKILMILCLSFVCTSCMSLSDKDKNASFLEMPEEYLGYWYPISRGLAGVGIDVHPDVILHNDDPQYYSDLAPEEIGTRWNEEYKVFYIDDNPDDEAVSQYVYAIVKSEQTEEWDREFLKIIGNTEEEIEEAMKEPKSNNYMYYRLNIIPSNISSRRDTYIQIRSEWCNLNKKDWDLPAHEHYQRIIIGDYCWRDEDPKYAFFSGGGTWGMDNKKLRYK